MRDMCMDHLSDFFMTFSFQLSLYLAAQTRSTTQVGRSVRSIEDRVMGLFDKFKETAL